MTRKATKKEGNKRLLILADLLEADAKNSEGVKFNLRTWGWNRLEEEEPKISCNTEACAVGLAALSPKLPGLTYKLQALNNKKPAFLMPILKSDPDVYHWDAIEHYFRISFDEARYLFSASEYDYNFWTGAHGERAVAKRIRSFVANRPC